MGSKIFYGTTLVQKASSILNYLVLDLTLKGQAYDHRQWQHSKWTLQSFFFHEIISNSKRKSAEVVS